MSAKHTQAEIVERIEARKSEDYFGFEVSCYMEGLDYEHAQPYLKEGVTEEQWVEHTSALPSPEDQIKEYMPFAWEKANGCRGLSAMRSIAHMVAWLWLAGEDDLLQWVESENQDNYQFYGKLILERICDHYELPWREWDDGVRRNRS